MLFVAFCCSFWFLVRVSICRSLPFAALRCSFLFLRLILSQKPKQANAFCCSLRLFVARLVFCGCFHFSIALLVVAFCWYEKRKRAKKAEEVQIETRLQQNMAVKLMERDVQRVWLKAGQECFSGDIYSISEASTTISNGL